MNISVFQSTVADGSMYNRHNHADPSVYQNREAFLHKHGLKPEQTTLFVMHFRGDDADYCTYQPIDADAKGRGVLNTDGYKIDALVTTTPGHALMLPVADCIAVTLFDPEHGVLMLSHLGRHSLEQQGAKKSVDYLVEHYQSRPETIQVWLSAAAGKDVYQIWALDKKGMKEAALEQLASAGIHPDNITDTPATTTDDENYFSYSEFLKGHRDEDGDHAMVAVMTD